MVHKVISASEGSVTNVEALKLLDERRRTRKEGQDLAGSIKSKATSLGSKKIEASEREVQAARKAMDAKLKEADSVMQKALQYLEKTPAQKQDIEKASKCLRLLKGIGGGRDLGLTAEERLMILNLAPDAAVVVNTIVDKYDTRYPDDDSVQNEILQLSSDYLR